MINFLSLLLLAGSPILLCIALAYILLRDRPLTAEEKRAQKEAVDRFYHRIG
jgi:hypothetical protein